MAKKEKNTIEKQKSALLGIGVAVLVLGLIGLAGGAVLVVFGAKGFMANGVKSVGGWIMTIVGALLVIFGGVGVGAGVRTIWVASAVKATRGSIGEGNIAKEYGTPNGVKCPKCGATNTPGSKECQVCHTPLE